MNRKYIPQQMISRSRFRNLYAEWSAEDRVLLTDKMDILIRENALHADSKNYGFMCNLLTSLAIVQVLESKGMPEMTAVFCKVDDILYGDLPRADFLYTQQIGTGGTMCDYKFRKK